MRYRTAACFRNQAKSRAGQSARSCPEPQFWTSRPFRTWIAFVLAILAIAGGSIFGASENSEVRRVQSPPSAGAISAVGGYVGERIRANTEGYLKPFDIDRYTKMVEEKRQREWWWIGEQPGKWLESAVLTSRHSRDFGLEQRGRTVLARLTRAQDPDGYLGITPSDLRTSAQPLRGMDPYEQYFMLHGLLTAAEEWHDTNALNTARRLGDYFVSHIGPSKAEFWPSPLRPPENVNTIICPQFTWVPEGTPKAPNLYVHSEIAGHTAHYGWEGTLLIDPMLRLYQATGERTYLEWCQWVVANIDKWSGWNSFSKLDAVADGKLGIHQLQPYVHAHTFQMNFLGFLRLYEITGDPKLLRKVRGAWEDIAKRQLYITGGVSVGEHFEPGYQRPLTGQVVETCANMSWLELTQDLLELTGEARFADVIERLLFNHVFAAQTVDGDCYRYHTPPNGFKPDDYFHGPDCCTGSGHRIVSMLPRFLCGQGPDGIYVNQYVSSTTRLKLDAGSEVELKVLTRYPEESSVFITVTPEKSAEFALHVRLPGWCDRPTLSVNGRPCDTGAPGAYVRIARTWNSGDTVQLNFPMNPRWIEHDHWTDHRPPHALERGPVVYALDTVWWNDSTIPAPSEAGTDVGWISDQAESKERTASSEALGPFYELKVELLDGRRAKACFVPFTNIGRWYRSGEKKPDAHSRAFSYAVWIQDRDSERFQEARRRIARESPADGSSTSHSPRTK